MIGALINLIIYLIIVGLLIWLVMYVIDAIPLPEPFNRIVKILVIVVGVLIIILALLSLAGEAPLRLPRIGWLS